MTAETEDVVVNALAGAAGAFSAIGAHESEDICAKALKIAQRDARLRPLYEALVDCAWAINRTNPTSSFRGLRNVLRSIEEANHD